MPRKTPGPPCQVCSAPSVAKGLCDKHYRRLKQYGNVEATLRPDDWGRRHKHPLWQSWKWTKRAGRVAAWNDFRTFVQDVGDRPGENHTLRRRDVRLPAGPDNFFWAEPVAPEVDRSKLEGRAAYMRAWNAKNPIRAKHHNLKKMFGIGIADYERLLVEQKGGCAICGQRDEWFSLAVDHCHDKGHVRGLLCSQCNRGLGLFADSLERLQNAVAYLEKSKRLI